MSTVIVVANFENSDLGWSFYLTVAAIAIVLLQVYVLKTYQSLSAVQIPTSLGQAIILCTWKKIFNGLPLDNIP